MVEQMLGVMLKSISTSQSSVGKYRKPNKKMWNKIFKRISKGLEESGIYPSCRDNEMSTG